MQEHVIFRYRTLRKIVALIALFIPHVCIIAIYLAQKNIVFPTSISVTYHLGAQDVFVGMLTIVGVFLLCYNGHKPVQNKEHLSYHWQRILFDKGFYKIHWEFWLCKLAGLGALFVAFFPTRFKWDWLLHEKLSLMNFPQLTYEELQKLGMTCHKGACNLSKYDWVPVAHIVGAVVLIFVLLLLCLNFAFRAQRKLNHELWPNGYEHDYILSSKIALRFRLYWGSFFLMVASIVVFGIMNFFGPFEEHAMMLIEIGCLWGFAFCWLTAGSDRFREDSDIENHINEQLLQKQK